MKHKESNNFSGIVVCDSITMSVKKKRTDLRWFEAVIIAVTGFVAVIMSFLEMFDFSYSASSVIKAAVIFSVIYIAFTLAGKKTFWFVGGSFLILAAAVYKFREIIIAGFKFTYNVIYKDSMHTEIDYYKYVEPEAEKYCVTVFFIFCIWLLALVIYTFTIHKPNAIIVVLFTFPIIEIGLYNGINIPVFWGVLTVAYWLAVLAVCNIDIGEYSGGKGGFVRKDNLFFPKKQMRLKVTEKCAVMLIAAVCIVAASTLAVMKLTNYKRSDELNQKRVDIKYAVSSFSFDDLASSVSAITESFGFTINYESHKLGTNSSIKYKNVTDLIVSIDKNCDGAVYLKGYAGAVYKNNEWLELGKDSYLESKQLFSDFKEYGIYPQDFPNIFSEALTETNDTTIWLKAKRKKNKSYAPYGTKNYGDMVYNQDSTVSSKKNGNNDYSYKFIAVDSVDAEYLLDTQSRSVFAVSDIEDSYWQEAVSAYCEENGLFSYSDYFAIDTELSSQIISMSDMAENGEAVMAALLESEYRDFVYENYLQVPDDENIAQVEEAFADILSNGSGETASDNIELLLKLRERIHSMTEYSLSPGKTPSNRDFVNYFLLENHKGYCTHYATTGVLLARMAGIPARYATGYVIVGDDFNESTKNSDGSYTVEVKDNRSHAWAEVYLDGFGWVPFEFTAGYSDMTINTETTTAATTETTQTQTTTKAPESSQTSSSKSSTQKATSKTTTASEPVKTTTADATPGFKSGNGTLATITDSTGFLVFVGIVAILLIWLRRYIILKLRNKRFTSGADSKRILHMYEYTEKLLAVLKVRKKDMQYVEFAEYAEGALAPEYFASGEFKSFMNIALKCSFDNSSPDKTAVSEALEFTEAFSKSIYEKSGVFKKFYLKIILVYI